MRSKKTGPLIGLLTVALLARASTGSATPDAIGGPVTDEAPVAGGSSTAPRNDTADIGTSNVETTFTSKLLGADLVILPGVFRPMEAEIAVLPLMAENPNLFAGRSVLEIGSGSGIVSLFAAKLGAKKVVATDINPSAVETTKRNAERLGYASVIDARLVPKSDMSAYSVIRPDEAFDVIISNPPYSLDLEAQTNDAATDKGDLGFSIVRGLPTHLKPDGVAVLLYRSLFYHLAMVKFARYSGFAVRNHVANSLTSWEAEAIFNGYLERLLVREKVDPKAFRFDRTEPSTLQGIAIDPLFRRQVEPLFPGNSKQAYPGFIVIERKDRTGS